MPLCWLNDESTAIPGAPTPRTALRFSAPSCGRLRAPKHSPRPASWPAPTSAERSWTSGASRGEPYHHQIHDGILVTTWRLPNQQLQPCKAAPCCL